MDERGPHLPQNSDRSERRLSVNEAVDTLYWSFYYSQGNIPLQENIMGYIAKKHPDWRISEENIPEILNVARERVLGFATRGPHIEVTDEERDEYNKRTMQLVSMLNTGTLVQDDGEIFKANKVSEEYILIEMIHRDRKFLADGRGNRNESLRGPHRKSMSHVVSYVLSDERPPGPPVFAELIRDLKSIAETWYRSGFVAQGQVEEALRSLEELRAAYSGQPR